MILTTKQADIRDELIQWGHWSSCLGLNLAMTTKSNLVPQISDERALAIDRVVAILSQKDQMAGLVLKNTFIQRYTNREIAKRYNINKNKVNALLNLAIGCVEMGLAVQAANDDKYRT